MAKNLDVGPREPASIDDAGVIQLVTQYGVTRTHQCRQGSNVGVVAGWENEADSVCLKAASLASSARWSSMVPEIKREAPAPQPNFSTASRAAVLRSRMAGEPQIIVGGKQQDLPTVETNNRLLSSLHNAQATKKSVLLQVGQSGLKSTF